MAPSSVPAIDAETEADGDAGKRRHDVPQQFAAPGELDDGGEDLGRRRHQPPVGQTEPDDEFPRQRQTHRQQQPERRPREAPQPARRRGRRRHVGPFHRGQFNRHGHSQTASGRRLQVGGREGDIIRKIFQSGAPYFPSPLVGEGGAKRRMRGISPHVQCSRREIPHPSRTRFARPCHPLPQGERGEWVARMINSSAAGPGRRSAHRPPLSRRPWARSRRPAATPGLRPGSTRAVARRCGCR